jgi:hypothetical protein
MPPELQDVFSGGFDSLDWLIMFMAIVSVKAHVKNDLPIYRLAVQHWDRLAEGLDGRTRTTPISEAQLEGPVQKNLPYTRKACRAHSSGIS